MESVLNFISVNYIWLLIIAVIILLAILGYIAEQNGFTENMKKTNKKNSKLNDLELTVLENIEENETSKMENIEENETSKMENIEDNSLNEELKQIEEEIELDEELNINNDDSLKSLNIDQDFNKVLEDVEETTNNANIKIKEEIPIELDEDDIWKF